MDNQDTMLKEIRDQTIKTNGRVNALESTLHDYDSYKATVSSLKDWKAWVMGGAVVVVAGGGLVWNLILDNVLSQMKENTEQLIEKSVDTSAARVVSQLEDKYNLKIE